jgi:hypothetical protein
MVLGVGRANRPATDLDRVPRPDLEHLLETPAPH